MRHPALRIIAALGASALILGSAPSALGQNRVFASARTGNDLNACSNIATPCQTLQGAVNQVAPGGAVLILDTGGYGPVTIGKAVTIEAPIGIEAFIHPPAGAAITVQAGGTDVVVLRGLTLSVGDQSGIDYLTAGALHVERCVIQGFPTGILVSRVFIPPVYADLYVEDTIVRNCTAYGIGVISQAGMIRVTLERCHLVENGEGLSVFRNVRTAMWNTVAAGNGVGVVLSALNGSSAMVMERCAADNNKTGGVQADGDIFSSPGTLWISNSTVTGNGGPGVNQVNTSQILSRTNNTVEGNVNDVVGSISSYSAK